LIDIATKRSPVSAAAALAVAVQASHTTAIEYPSNRVE